MLAIGTAVEITLADHADRAAATRAARRAIAQLDVEAAVSLTLLHRAGAPPVAMTGAEQRVLPFSLSIAHRHGHAIAAAAPAGTHVGVDVEPCNSIACAQLRMFATDSECDAGLDPTTLWVLKEAAWKALKCPASLPLQALMLDIVDGKLVRIRAAGRQVPARAHVWTPWHDWVAALVMITDEDERA